MGVWWVAFAALLVVFVSSFGQQQNPFESRQGSEAFRGPGETNTSEMSSSGRSFVSISPIYFPTHPPPLDVTPKTPLESEIRHPIKEELMGEMMEPFFPQLSSRLVSYAEFLSTSDGARWEEYKARRDQLLGELRRKIDELEGLDAAARHAEYSAFGRAQEPSLQKLEEEAESLRHRLAKEVDWYEYRRWRLGNGTLDLPREQLALFEYQVVRATAFYRDGLSPAQRRVLREALQLMDHKSPPGNEPPDDFVFFSPDMMRVRFPSTLPPNVAERVAAFLHKKDELRGEFRDAAYEADFLGSDYSRRKAIERFARQEAGRLDELEDEAEQIRIELMPARDGWRRSPPGKLPEELQAMIDQYLLGKKEIRIKIHDAVGAIKRKRLYHRGTIRYPELRALLRDQQDRMDVAQDEVLVENADRLAELDALLDQIEAALEPYMMAEDFHSRNRAIDAFLLSFLQRRNRETAFYEYDIAAFEPGLSPLQRQLLFTGAVARLDLPLGSPERQQTFEPAMVVPVE